LQTGQLQLLQTGQDWSIAAIADRNKKTKNKSFFQTVFLLLAGMAGMSRHEQAGMAGMSRLECSGIACAGVAGALA
jgi:hypothetical protein